MNPLPNCEVFIRTALLADDNLEALVGDRIYSGSPPETPIEENETVLPCVVFSFNSSSTTTAFGEGDSRVLELLRYLIKAVTEDDDYGTAHLIADAVDEVMRSISGTAEFNSKAVDVQSARKEQWIEYSERDPRGIRYNHVGATYRLFVSGI